MDRAAAFHVEPSHGLAAAGTTAAAHPLLTNRLRAAHVGINGARDTPHTLTTSVSRHRTIGLAFRLAPAAAFLCLLVMAAPAGAAPSCGRQVIDDWFDDSRVDHTYPLHCYDDAIELLQPDVRDYSNAVDEITRALQRRGRTASPPPVIDDPSPGEGPGPVTGGPGEKPPKPSTTPTTTTVGDPEIENPPVAAPPLDSASASSVPIPLLVLTGLALLLIAGGSAGYFVRRHEGRKTPPPGA